MNSTCDELKRKFRDFENMHLWAPDYLSKRKELLARYEQQIIVRPSFVSRLPIP